MCGRFLLTSPAQAIAEAFGVEEPADLAPRYNIAPSQSIAAVRADPSGRRELAWLRWGLIPGWTNESARPASPINARAETAPEKPTFRDAFRARRCLVPANGFYEWQATPAGKQPWVVGREGGEPFAMAALWESWKPREGPAVESCALLTTEANELMRPIHDRMPVILDQRCAAIWLDPVMHDVGLLRSLLRPYAGAEMSAHVVGKWVNDPRHEDPGCLEPP